MKPIRIKKSEVGSLHRELGVPLGHPIPLEKLQRAKRSKSPKLRRKAQFAINAKKFRH